MLLKLTAVGVNTGTKFPHRELGTKLKYNNISAKFSYEQKRQLWQNRRSRNKCDGTVDYSDTIQFILAIGHDFTLNY